MLRELLPLLTKIRSSFALLEARDASLSKFARTIVYVQDVLVEFSSSTEPCIWTEKALDFSETINNEIWNSETVFAKHLRESLILDGSVTLLPRQIQEKLPQIIAEIKEHLPLIPYTMSQPLPEVELDPIDEIFCESRLIGFPDEFDDWFTNHRPRVNCRNPYQYWHNNATHPNLRSYALKLFLHSPSSVSYERFFSTCKYVASDQKQGMTPAHFVAQCMVHGNLSIAKQIINKS